jgi:hypothetical protein
MDSHLNELSKGGENGNPIKYNLRSKKKDGKIDTFDQPTKTKNSTKAMETSSKEKDAKNPQALDKIPTPEVKEILKSPSSFRFESEIQKIKNPCTFFGAD